MVLKYDFSKLKGRIIEKFETRRNFATFIGKDESNINKCLAGVIKFSQERIEIWCDALEIPREEIALYFFTLKDNK